ncbi:hypothetical protein COLO4_04274 [Corchorus olitorius]|uniref:Uncharacterized protein n=1 Tax=Corchorus olitorius TaxID=93759 RepID=A0A1R3KUL3_9ROSI|nr:hypothetical protein COLO4_04274 [Corchorus olitorius]
MMFVVGLALLSANNMESRRIPTTPLWFKTKIHDNGLWSNVKTCIYSTRVCQDLAITSIKFKSFELSIKKLSPIEEHLDQFNKIITHFPPAIRRFIASARTFFFKNLVFTRLLLHWSFPYSRVLSHHLVVTCITRFFFRGSRSRLGSTYRAGPGLLFA